MRKLYIMDAIIDGIEYSRNGININFGMTALLWIICLVLACFFLYKEAKNNHAAAVCLKGMASLCFVLLGLLGKKYSQDPSLAEKVFFGLCLGMIADILLNLRYVFPKIGQKIFLVGILVFLAGHVMYIAALIPKSRCLTFSLIAAVILTAVLSI